MTIVSIRDVSLCSGSLTFIWTTFDRFLTYTIQDHGCHKAIQRKSIHTLLHYNHQSNFNFKRCQWCRCLFARIVVVLGCWVWAVVFWTCAWSWSLSRSSIYCGWVSRIAGRRLAIAETWSSVIITACFGRLRNGPCPRGLAWTSMSSQLPYDRYLQP